MAKAPVRFKRVAAAFNEASRVIRLCESSGSDHYSSENSADLSDLVNSFIEQQNYRINVEGDKDMFHGSKESSKAEESEDSYSWSDSETKDMLENLLNNNNEENDVDVREKIRAQTQLACEVIVEKSSQSFKRALTSRLRDQGFDAGLCKSRWENFRRHPAGDYEYVDVNVDGNRYIVEVLLAGEFEIARPTSGYAALLDVFPHVFIGKPEELKEVVKLMCSAIRKSMKTTDMHVPPWRRNGYMRAKWFSNYKRTINEVPSRNKSTNCAQAGKCSNGFETLAPLPVRVTSHCRDDFASKVGLKISYLTAAFNGNVVDTEL